MGPVRELKLTHPTEPHPIVVFDGVCNFCNASVQFILQHDRSRVFRFAALQSSAGRALLERHGFDPLEADTFVLVEGEKCRVRSDAALGVARRLPLPWRLVFLLRWIPRPLRDAVYRTIARNRYRWFGKRESCMVPSADVSERFLE